MYESQKKAVKKYQDTHYEFIKIRLNKGDKDKIKGLAEADGLSVNAYILKAVFGTCGR